MNTPAPAAEADALRRRVEETVGANFQVEEEIGRGGMAVVYRALDKRLRRRVALKVLPPDLAFRADVRSRFVREAQIAAQLSHPNIVPIFGVDESGGIAWFAMGLVEGDPLAKLLSFDPRPSAAMVRRILREVCEGLSYAHSQGVVHRDIKPDNILIEKSTGRALVTDFGIARAAEGDLKLTATGVAVGTPAYMSPEQAMGEKDVDGRADLYALGVVGWQMLAGELPFQAENTPGMLMKHISEPPRPLSTLRSGLPDNLVYAIERAMAKGRNDRWADAIEFRDALAESASAPREAFSNAMTPPDLPAAPRSPRGYVPPIHVENVDSVAGGELRGPSSSKPWRFDPLRDSALQSDSGEQALKKWREERRAWRERQKAEAEPQEPMSRRELRQLRREEWRERRELARDEREARQSLRTPEDRIRGAQKAVVGAAIMTTFLAAINLLTSPQFPWFLFPALAFSVGVATRIGGLWVDGIPLRRLFRHQPIDRDSQAAAEIAAPSARRSLPRLPAPDLRGVAHELLDGPHGGTIREAAEAKVVIADVYTRLPEHEKLNLPDVQATAGALEERIRQLAGAMHQLDRDASPDAMKRLERKLEDAKASGGDTTERERRVTLLERQYATLKDLVDRRTMVGSQLENAALLLQTMKLDMLKLKSSALEAKIQDSTMGTQEARAVGRDIERVVDAANEVRKL